MRVGGAHLTYCTNVHAGETLADVQRGLREHVCAVKARVCPDAPFGVGLWLSARAADELAQGDALSALRAWLDAHGLYVFTLNGFPFGAFHGRVVKTAVYAPDWRDPRRLAYSNQLAQLLAGLLPDGVEGSISTLPGGFRPWLSGAADEARIADNLLCCAAHLHALERTRGKRIGLALEPEPGCMLETSADAVGFFARHLQSDAARTRVAALIGGTRAEAAEVIARHLGLCFDACHAAVEHERAEDAVRALEAAGISLLKLQLSAGIRVARMNAQHARALSAYAEDVYLHQVVARRGDRLLRYLDLPDALAAFATEDAEGAEPTELRVHYHVPVFLERLREFESTQPFLRELLALQRARPRSTHLEVETYTWSVLPDDLQARELSEGLARELAFCLEELGAGGVPR